MAATATEETIAVINNGGNDEAANGNLDEEKVPLTEAT